MIAPSIRSGANISVTGAPDVGVMVTRRLAGPPTSGWFELIVSASTVSPFEQAGVCEIAAASAAESNNEVTFTLRWGRMGRIVRRSGRPPTPSLPSFAARHFAPRGARLVLPGRKAMCFNVPTVAALDGDAVLVCGWARLLVLLGSGCTELRGRRSVREGNRLYREGRYQEAVAVYEQAESLIPNFWLLWLNKGLTCRQLMIPGSRQSANQQAANCALAAFDEAPANSVPRIRAATPCTYRPCSTAIASRRWPTCTRRGCAPTPPTSWP